MSIPRKGSLADQIASTLRFEIASNFKAGERLPGMHELRKRFDVSINTIGAALDILASAGLVDKRRGSGVYVREGGGRRRMAVVSELDLMDPRISPYWRVLASEVMASLKAAGQLTQLYVGHAEPGRPSDEPTCTHFWDDMEAGRLAGAVLLDLPLTPAWAQRVKNSPIPMVGALTGYTVVTDTSAVTSAAWDSSLGTVKVSFAGSWPKRGQRPPRPGYGPSSIPPSPVPAGRNSAIFGPPRRAAPTVC